MSYNTDNDEIEISNILRMNQNYQTYANLYLDIEDNDEKILTDILLNQISVININEMKVNDYMLLCSIAVNNISVLMIL